MVNISIIIPCYNHGLYIEDAIRSIEQYKYNDYEIIIINDGSTDEFTNIKLKELKEKGYNVIYQENQGLSRTRNNAIMMATGKYILPLDADNMIKPEYITKSIRILEENPSISIVYSDRQNIGESDELVKVGEFNARKILTGNYIDACAIYRKTVWEAIGGYDANMPVLIFEDWDFWLSAIEQNFKFYYIPEPLFYYRVLHTSMVHRSYSDFQINELLKYIYKKHIQILYKVYKETFFDLDKSKFEITVLEFERGHPFRTGFKYLYRWLLSK